MRQPLGLSIRNNLLKTCSQSASSRRWCSTAFGQDNIEVVFLQIDYPDIALNYFYSFGSSRETRSIALSSMGLLKSTRVQFRFLIFVNIISV